MTSSFTPPEIGGCPNSDTQDAVSAGIALAKPTPLDSGAELYTQVVPAGGKLEVIDVQKLIEPYNVRPRRKKGLVHVHTADSFIDYLKKHAIPETEVWADTAGQKLVAVINAHQEAEASEDATAADNGAGFGDHRVDLELVKTDAWKAWASQDRKFIDQVSFANHIEENGVDIIVPDAATMLEISESFQASTAVDFKSAQRLHSGQVSLKYTEQGNARAGENGDIEIPTEFVLSIAPFEGHREYEITARFRYRIREGQLSLSYVLVKPGDVLRQAFIDYVEAVAAAISAPVFRGRPE